MNIQVDLRGVAADKVVGAARAFPANVRLLITAWQWSILKSQVHDAELAVRMSVVVPDFLHYARLAGTGQAAEILRLPSSLLSVARAGVACVPTGVKLLPQLARGQFWAAALAMTRYDLALIGSRFPGEVLLHDNLADFACFFERDSLLREFKSLSAGCGAWGIATQQVPALLSLCARQNIVPDRLLFNTGMTRPESDLLDAARGGIFAGMRTTVDFTQWPAELISSADFHDFSRPGDDTWLLSTAAALDLC